MSAAFQFVCGMALGGVILYVTLWIEDRLTQ